MYMSDNSTGFGSSLKNDPKTLRPDFDPAGFFASSHQVGTGELAAEQSRLATQGRNFNDAKITNIYDGQGRQQQYADYLANLRGLYTGQVNDQHDVAARQLKFADARAGLTGGSASADAGGMLRKDYEGGLLSADSAAISGVDSLRAADQASKANLISLNDSAASTGQSASNTLRSADQSLTANLNAATPQTLGNFFGDVGGVYQQRQGVAAQMRGYQRAGLYG